MISNRRIYLESCLIPLIYIGYVTCRDDSRVLRANCNFDIFAKFVDGVDNIEIHSEESI